jgi:hypothetical protein
MMRVLRALTTRKFALAAFLIPLGIRAIPEIIVGPYPIGWDTIAFYVPNTLDWATGKLGWVALIGTAPLLYMISVSVYLVARINPVWIFKIIGPLLYGSMMLALYRFLRVGLRWTEKMSLGAGLMTSLYFVTLRVSWDLYRNMLGLTFILLSLPLFASLTERKSQVLLAVLVVLAVASDQLTGVIALSLIGARALAELFGKRWDQFVRLTRIGVPGLVFFLSVAYAGIIASSGSFVQQQAALPGLASIISSAGFLGYIYLPIIPLVLLGLRRTVNVDLRNWTIVLLGLALTALVPLSGLIVMSYRWSLLLDIPLCVYASAGVAGILGASRPATNWSRILPSKILPVISLILAVSAALYVAVPAQQAMPYYAAFPSFLPTSMVQNTVPMSDMGSLRAMLDWVQANSGPGTILITHQAIYGWARTYLPSTVHIVNYRYSDPMTGVGLALLAGYSSVLMIWWINGSGWHGQPSVPSGFVPLVSDGSIVVYEYD